ncbi:unnamed protein product [Camellia sinensis]
MKKRERACMAYSAKKWAGFISYIASRTYFLLILLQFPLFRVPCRGGICTTPLEVASCHLIATEVLPAVVVKILLYPGAVADAFLKNKSIPNFNNLLNAYPNFNNLKRFDDTNDIHRIEVIVGSYLSVAGALLGYLRPGRMSFVGTLLVLWGLAKELFMGRHQYPKKAISVYPTMLIAPVLAFFSIKGDVKKLIRSFRHHTKAKYY